MKKIEKLILKLDVLTVVLIFAIFVVGVSVLEKDELVKACYSLVGVPTFIYLIQHTISRRQENVYYNIDVYIKKRMKSGIEWRLPNDIAGKHSSYVNIVNTSKVSALGIYIKIVKNDGTIAKFKVNELLNGGEEINLRVPIKRTNMKEIIITSMLMTEEKTKKFCGVQSGCDGKYIFSMTEKYNSKKNTVFYKDKKETFQNMERFMMKK